MNNPLRMIPLGLHNIFWCKVVQVYSEPCQTSKMEFFAKMIDGLHLLTIFAKKPILDSKFNIAYSLREKYPYLEFFWSVFSRIQFECGKVRTRKFLNRDTFFKHWLSICWWHVHVGVLHVLSNEGITPMMSADFDFNRRFSCLKQFCNY